MVLNLFSLRDGRMRVKHDLRVANDPPTWAKAAALELQLGNQLQEPDKGCAFIRS